jgi:hypothetical protein
LRRRISDRNRAQRSDPRGRKRKSKLIGDKETALTVARAIRERLAAGDLHLGPVGSETLESYAVSWQKGCGHLKASTARFYSENLKRHILPAIESVR